MERWLALELASTIRHDGDGGVADDLATVDGTARWIQDQADLLAAHAVPGEVVADEDLRSEITELRRAVRALFARTVSPAPPSPADARRLMPADRAIAHLNAVAAREPVVPQLHWPPEGPPTTRLRSPENDPATRLVAALARAAIDFLSGPQHERLRACTAPRCVRYFVKTHGRQEWCKPSCGNRARAARHYRRHRPAPDDGQSVPDDRGGEVRHSAAGAGPAAPPERPGGRSPVPPAADRGDNGGRHKAATPPPVRPPTATPGDFVRAG